MTILEQKATPCTPAEAIAYIADAYEAALGHAPAPESLAILVSQSALETGQWHAMYNWNAGNIRGAFEGFSQPIKNANEVVDGKIVTGKDVEAGFRAYLNAEDGFGDFVRFLMIDTTPDNGRPNKWHIAADAVERGDLKAYVFALSDPDGNPTTSDGYFTADPNVYYDGGDGPGGRPGMLALYDQFLPLCRQHVGDTEPPTVPDTERPGPPDITESLAVELSKLKDIERHLANGFVDLNTRATVADQKLGMLNRKLDSVMGKLDHMIAVVESYNATVTEHHRRIERLENRRQSNGTAPPPAE